MEQNLLCLTLTIFYLCIVRVVSDSPCDGSDWVAYEDEKCFKLIKKYASRDEAEEICNKEYRTDLTIPTLVSIKSVVEQEYLTKFVFDTSGVKVNVWIGAKRIENGSQFIWDDGSDIKFTNWAERSPSEVIGKDCVEMQSMLSRSISNISDLSQQAINGKWKDVTCELGSWVLCQKLQPLTVPKLQKMILDVRNELQNSLKDITKRLETAQNSLNDTKEQLNNFQQNPVPIGFIYVELPTQPVPENLWPSVRWRDISSDYAGLFFRVLGGGSASFGTTQGENSPRITQVSYQICCTGDTNISIPSQGWSSYVRTGGREADYDGMGFYVSGGEVRPLNKAIRIWKRIE